MILRDVFYLSIMIDSKYADNPKISTIYVVRKLLGFKSDEHRV